MSSIFIDTSFLLAILIADDAMHDRATALQKKIKGPFLTTEYGLVELLGALTAESMRPVALQAVALLRADAGVPIIDASTMLFEAGVKLFRDRPDKQWGITDCISFHIMAEANVREALTADRHFQQAGFHALLRSEI